MQVFHHHCRRLRFIVHDHRRLAIRQRQRGSARARACVCMDIYTHFLILLFSHYCRLVNVLHMHIHTPYVYIYGLERE